MSIIISNDFTKLCNDFTKLCNDYIDEHYPGEFTSRTYKSKVSNAQEAHECIRPVSLLVTADDIGDELGRKVYDMIWKRTLSVFMPSFKEDIHSFSFVNKNDKLDEISNGNKVWYDVVSEVYNSFIEKVKTLGSDSNIEITKKTVYKEELLFEKEDSKYFGYRDKYGVCVIRVDTEGNRKKVRVSKDLTINDIDESNR